MPRRARPYHHGDLSKALLSEAANLVETEGVAALTLRELARRLGVSHAAPTSHFADKDALLGALAAQGFGELADALAAARGGTRGTAAARLRELGRAYVRFAREKPGHYRVMFGRGWKRQLPPGLAHQGDRAYALLEEAVTAAHPVGRAAAMPERVREAVFLAWSVVHGAAMLLLDGPLAPVLAEGDVDVAQRLIDHATSAVALVISAPRA
jgi:AcrR family transcriptional regulator